MNGFVENWHLNSEGTVQLMLNSFCKQNDHLGVEFAKVPTVCKVKILWQTHHHPGSGRRWLSKMHVDKNVLGKGFGCTGTSTNDIYMDSYVNP